MATIATEGLSVERVTFPAGDGFRLQGLLVRHREPQLAVLVSAATGFPVGFYRRLANDFASRGAVVLLYDYRGIGASAPDRLADFVMDYVDWGRLDMPAALDTLAAAAPGLPISHIGHSVGGHFVGFARNHDVIRRHAFTAVGSGYWGKHSAFHVPLEMYFWWLLGPLALLRWGYIPKIGGWKGAPLPKDVFTTWRRWCHSPRYYRDELDADLQPHYFRDVRSPIRSWVYADDPIANRRTASDILVCFPNAPSSIVVRTPAEIGVNRIGHEGGFQARPTKLWDEWWDWLSSGG